MGTTSRVGEGKGGEKEGKRGTKKGKQKWMKRQMDEGGETGGERSEREREEDERWDRSTADARRQRGGCRCSLSLRRAMIGVGSWRAPPRETRADERRERRK